MSLLILTLVRLSLSAITLLYGWPISLRRTDSVITTIIFSSISISLVQIASVLVALVTSTYPYSDYANSNPDYSFAYEVLSVLFNAVLIRAISFNIWLVSFLFFWKFRDTYSGQDFGHQEARKQDAVTGEYRVLLPDDRLQVVRYTADHNGYVADVQYTDGSSSPAYGVAAKAASGYSSAGYQPGGATVKTSSYFNPSSSSNGYSYGGSTANSQGAGYNSYQNGQGLYQQANQAFKSGCVCQCPS